jgi:hypothetical protein
MKITLDISEDMKYVDHLDGFYGYGKPDAPGFNDASVLLLALGRRYGLILKDDWPREPIVVDLSKQSDVEHYLLRPYKGTSA